MSVEVGYVGNRGRNVFAGDGPAINVNQPTLDGYPNVPQNNRKPFFAGGVGNDLGLGGAFGWTQGIDFFCNCANNAYDSLQAKFNKRFSGGYSVKMNYTLQRQVQESGDYFFYDVEMNKGPADWDRTHNFVFSLVAELPVGRDKRYLSSISPVADAFIGGWQFNTNTIIQSGLPFSVNYRDAGADRDTGGNNRPNLTGDPEGPQTRDQWFNADADRLVRERVFAAGARNLRRHGAELASRARILESGRVALQAPPAVGESDDRAPPRGRQSLQPRESRQPRLRGRRAGQ